MTKKSASDAPQGKVTPGVGVGLLIHHPDNFLGRPYRFLIHLRGPLRDDVAGTPGVRNDPDLWDLPGGGVEFGQLILEAGAREAEEEHGLVIPPNGIQMGWVIEDIKRDATGHPVEHWVSHTLVVTQFSGVPQIMEPQKCRDMGWLTLREIATLPNITSTTYLNLAHLQGTNPEYFV